MYLVAIKLGSKTIYAVNEADQGETVDASFDAVELGRQD